MLHLSGHNTPPPRANRTMQMKAQTLLWRGKQESKKENGRGERGLSGRRGLCQLMIVSSTRALWECTMCQRVVYVQPVCTCLRVSRSGDGGVWKERWRALCFDFSQGWLCFSPFLQHVPEQHQRERDPASECEPGTTVATKRCSGINMQTGELPAPQHSTSGQIELL